MNNIPGTKIQIIDVGWRYDLDKDAYSQILKVFDYKDNTEKVIALDKYEFAFELSEQRHCNGYRDSSGFHACKFMQELTKNDYEKCYHCEKEDGFKSAFFFGEDPNERMKEHLAQKHFIYLAWFQPNIIKVGTAAASRKYIRPIEQDALIYCYIAQSDGFSIQQLERHISTNLKITEFVKSSTKFKNLDSLDRSPEPVKRLNESVQNVQNFVKNHASYTEWLINPEVVDLRNRSEIFVPESVQKIGRKETTFLVGKHKGLRGRYILIENHGNIFAIDYRKVIGRFIQKYTDNYIYESQIPQDDQLSLI